MSIYIRAPWTADTAPLSNGVIGVYAEHAPTGSKMIAECFGPRALANARLIAAAPEMADLLRSPLDACYQIRDGNNTPHWAITTLQRLNIRALLTKIEGE
ncbi:MAG: hypothetical protein GY906_24225 [bacterium]|nr:hypothetical protein [bacterium]